MAGDCSRWTYRDPHGLRLFCCYTCWRLPSASTPLHPKWPPPDAWTQMGTLDAHLDPVNASRYS